MAADGMPAGGMLSAPSADDLDGLAGLPAFRRIPHNIEAEMAVLGAILVNPRAYERVADFLRPEHFSYGPHRAVYRTLGSLIEGQRLADGVVLKTFLGDAGALNEAGGPAYINRLIDCAVTVINAGEYGLLVRDLAVRRELIGLGEDMVNRAYGDGDEWLEAAALINDAGAALRAVEEAAGDSCDLEPEMLVDMLAEPIEPRGWLLGNTICRKFMTILAASGGTGKTALAITFALSLATGRRLAGMHVHKRCRVLFLTLEDGREEYKRRFKAACDFHGITPMDVGDRLWIKSVTAAGASKSHTLVRVDERGETVQTGVADRLRKIIRKHKFDVCFFDPFIKLSGAPENNNSATDAVAKILTGIAEAEDVAVCLAHHFRKGAAVAGDADSTRGAGSLVDAARFSYTLMPMSTEDARYFGIRDEDRLRYIRMDDAKMNLTARGRSADWFFLHGVSIGNGTPAYPKGDNVQAVESWKPPETWDGIPIETLNAILDDIDAGMEGGERYSGAKNATANAAWRVVKQHLPEKPDAQCREIIRDWLESGLLAVEEHFSPSRRESRPGLVVDHSKRPGRNDA